MRILVSARLQATAAPDAPEPMMRTSTLSFMPRPLAPCDKELLVDAVLKAPVAQIARRRARGESAIVAHALGCVEGRVRRQHKAVADPVLVTLPGSDEACLRIGRLLRQHVEPGGQHGAILHRIV